MPATPERRVAHAYPADIICDCCYEEEKVLLKNTLGEVLVLIYLHPFELTDSTINPSDTIRK